MVDLSRRGVLTGLGATAGLGALSSLAVTGCAAGSDARRDGAPAQPAPLTPDVTVATRALAEIEAVAAAVAATTARFPATRSQVADLARVHRAHAASLADAVPDRAQTSATPAPPTPYRVPQRQGRALPALVTREQQLHQTLDSLALQAQSGDFARLLASMGAAVAQRLAVLA